MVFTFDSEICVLKIFTPISKTGLDRKLKIYAYVELC